VCCPAQWQAHGRITTASLHMFKVVRDLAYEGTVSWQFDIIILDETVMLISLDQKYW
jgi:hypothetical protein